MHAKGHPAEQLQHASLIPHTQQCGTVWADHRLSLVWEKSGKSWSPCDADAGVHCNEDAMREARVWRNSGPKGADPSFPEMSSYTFTTDHSYSPIQCAYPFRMLQ